MAFEINLSVGELSASAAALDKLARYYDRIAGAQAQIAAGIAVPGGGGGGTGGGASGPMARLQAAFASFQRVKAGGDPTAIFDAQDRLSRAQEAARRAQARQDGPNRLQNVMQALLSSRFGAGGMQPLVGRTLAALGIDKALAGPIALVAGGAALLGAALHAAVSAVQTFTVAAAESGGRVSDVAMLSGLGIGAGQIAGAAAGLRQRMASDPYAMGAASRLGVGPLPPRPFGPVNEAKVLRDTLEALRKVTNAEEQLTLARMLGIESMVALLRVSEGVWAQIRQDAAVTERIQDPQTQRAAADASTGFNRMGASLQNLMNAALEPIIPLLGLVSNAIASAINALADWLNNLMTMPTMLTQLVSDLFNDPSKAFANFKNTLADKLDKQPGWIKNMWGDFANKDNSALDQNTQATMDNTRALREGTFGGGPRAAALGRSGLRGEMLREAIEGQGLRMGAFVV